MSALVLGTQLLGSWAQFDGIRHLNGASPLADMDIRHALNMVYAWIVEHVTKEDRDTFEGWMTCSLEQAVEFLGMQQEEEKERRLSAARIAGALG